MFYYFIINPSSSSGKHKTLWREIKKQLENEKIAYKVAATKKTGDAKRLAREESLQVSEQNPCTIVAIGGDGTVNEVVNGLMLSPFLSFGYIPTGSGNDLARGLGLSKEPLEALDFILHPKEKKAVRIGQVVTKNSEEEEGEKRRFVISSGAGFDAAVCHHSIQSKTKNMLNFLRIGKLTYLFTALKLLMKYPYTKAELVLDNQNRKEYQRGILFSAFMNTRYEGGGFLFCPDAEPCDDFLDICLVEKIPKLMILCVLPTAFFGKHVIFKKVVHIERCKKAVLTMEEAVPIHTDGENAGVKKIVEVSLEEQPLNFIIR